MDCKLETPHGPARAHLRVVEGASAALVLGHGAGGGVGAPDLQAAARAAVELGVSVALVEQPYRVAGRRSQPPAAQLDAAWLAAIEQLRSGALENARIVAGGRSAGARVACRTAADAGAVAVLCLAFPVHPPGRAGDPSKSRLDELESVRVPVAGGAGRERPVRNAAEGPAPERRARPRQPFAAEHLGGRSCRCRLAPASRQVGARLARRWWTRLTAIDPSPTADAHRLIDPECTSPTAKIPGWLVSRNSGRSPSGYALRSPS